MKLSASVGCAVLFILSAVIIGYGDAKTPSEDYGDSVKTVFYMYEETASAVNPVSAEHILNITESDKEEITSAEIFAKHDVLPPVLRPPVSIEAAGVN